MLPTEHEMKLWDGTAVFYRAWQPDTPTDKALLLFHRGHEHSGRFIDVVEELGLKDVAVFAWDARGHGRSMGDRGYAPSFGCMARDVDCFVRHVAQSFGKPLEQMTVLAHSVGAVAVAAWVHDYAPPIRALVLASPALRVKLYVPLAIPGLRLMQALGGRGGRRQYIKSYVKARLLTHDPAQARRFEQDPLISRSIAVNILLGLHDAATRLIADAGAIRVPTLLLTGDADWVVKMKPQLDFYDRLGSPVKRLRIFKGMYHDILHEQERGQVLDEARGFIAEAYEGFAPPPPPLDADRQGYTRDEYERLGSALTPLSPRWFNFKIQRLALKTLGRLSQGVRLGLATGFDSGQTLDYVYENRPRGGSFIGRGIDRAYLGSIGWRGIRQRKVHVEELLRAAMKSATREGHAVRVLDIAAGPGRYLLEAIQALPGVRIEARLRDNKPANLEEGRRLAGGLGLKDSVVFEEGDAFDEAALAALEPPPDIAVVSGLYELFPDNRRVLGSLRGLARAMRGGGWLIYTGQPWHPQLEMIARVLVNREGVPWIMRRRTQQEMDALVREAGFEKIDERIDEDGIFTVSLARTRD